MSLRHHPQDDLLLSYAAGTLDEGVSLIVATHLSFCAQCRQAVAQAEALGGALMTEAVPLADSALAATLSRLDAVTPQTRHAVSRDGTPSALRHALGRDLSDVRWRAMGPKLAYANLYRRGRTRVRLLKGAPGADTGSHGHQGEEYTLVLRGGFTDETGSYGPGDLQVATSDTHHNPIADAGEPCINLAVTTAPLSFDALVPRLAARLFGF